MTTEILTERMGSTLLITLSGPATRNALSPQVYAAGVEILSMAESSPEVRAVVITGAGKPIVMLGFCIKATFSDVQREREDGQSGHFFLQLGRLPLPPSEPQV